METKRDKKKIYYECLLMVLCLTRCTELRNVKLQTFSLVGKVFHFPQMLVHASNFYFLFITANSS